MSEWSLCITLTSVYFLTALAVPAVVLLVYSSAYSLGPFPFLAHPQLKSVCSLCNLVAQAAARGAHCTSRPPAVSGLEQTQILER